MKKAFVTGGAGLVGSRLLERLSELGVHVVSFDNLSGSSEPYIHSPMINHVVGDVRNFNDVLHASDGCDVFFHLAASGNVIQSLENPFENLQNNVVGTVLIAAAAKIKQRGSYSHLLEALCVPSLPLVKHRYLRLCLPMVLAN